MFNKVPGKELLNLNDKTVIIVKYPMSTHDRVEEML